MVGDSLLGARVPRAELVARELEREIVDERDPGERLGTKDDLRTYEEGHQARLKLVAAARG